MKKIIFYLRRFIYFLFNERFKKTFKYHWNNYPARYEILNKIIQKKKFKDYLEIGCFKDENFNKIIINNKIGVDPYSGGTLRMTSDDFFKNNNKSFDLIFIDGLHVYEQVKKDIINSLNFLKEGGIILCHDCLPRKIWYQTPKRMSYTWNGDVWKSIVEFRTKENVDVYTMIADEGLGVIFKRQNQNLLKLNNMNFKNLKFKDYYTNHEHYMNLITVEKFFREII